MSDRENGEYVLVRSSYRNRPYFRRKPYTASNPTIAQRDAREALARIAIELGRDKKGTVLIEKDGAVKEIPSSALPIMQLKGKRFTTRRAPVSAPQSQIAVLESFVKALESLASLSSS